MPARVDTAAGRASLKPGPGSSEMPWRTGRRVEVTTNTLHTKLGPVACYYAGDQVSFLCLKQPFSKLNMQASQQCLMLLHGCPSQFTEFTHLLPGLVWAGCRVIGFDQPGYGASPGVRAPSRSDRAMEPGGPIDLLKEIIKEFISHDMPTLLCRCVGSTTVSFHSSKPK